MVKIVINNTELLNEYKNHLEESKVSKNTKLTYLSNVQRFIDFAGVGVGEISGCHIDKYFEHKKDLKPASLHLAKTAIVDFIRFAELDIASNVRLPKVERAMSVIPSPTDFKKILFIAGGKVGHEGIRNQALLSVMYHAGLRIDESRCLEMDDIDFEQRNIYVFGKGAKRRVVPINDTLLSILSLYSEVRPYASSTQKLFLSFGKNHKLEPLAYGSFRQIIKMAFKDAGYSNLAPYSLRHAFCTKLICSGTDLKVVAALLGHSDVSSIFHYYVPDNLDGREAVKALNF